jgi:hypothetical protein
MNYRLVPLVAVAALMLAACQETPSETAKDVAAARHDAVENVDAARQDKDKVVSKNNDQVADARQAYVKTDEIARQKLTQVESDAMVKTANADFEIASAEATGRNEIAVQRCDALTGVDKDACVSAAAATLASEQATATSNRDAMLVAADNHE